MKTGCAELNAQHRRRLSFIALTVLLSISPLGLAIAQTNLTRADAAGTNITFRLPAPIDFQRLQYYYVSYQNSPAPGTEHGIFTVGNNRIWNGDWNSTVVPKPSRAQLNAITPAQVDLFSRAGVYTNGVWQIVTSQTNVPLSTLTITPSTYTQIRMTAGRDKQLAAYQRIQPQSTQSRSINP